MEPTGTTAARFVFLWKFCQVNVAVILALDPRVIIAAIEEDMGEGIRREVRHIRPGVLDLELLLAG